MCIYIYIYIYIKAPPAPLGLRPGGRALEMGVIRRNIIIINTIIISIRRPFSETALRRKIIMINMIIISIRRDRSNDNDDNANNKQYIS